MSAPQRRWLAAYLFCAAAAALPFLATYRLPSADLPQHAAQIALWKSFADRCYNFDAIYEINWFTPYLAGYCNARLFAFVLTVNAALKLTMYVAALALVMTMRLLTERAGIDAWLALIGFPLAFGFSFYWGFVNFLIAVPLGIYIIILQYRQVDAPTLRRAVLIACAGLLLMTSHALAVAVFIGIAAAVHLAYARSWRSAILGLIPLAIPAPPLFLWFMWMRSQETRAQQPLQWQVGPARLLTFFRDVLAAAPDPKAVAVVVVIIGVIALSGVRPARDWRRYLPVAGAAGAYLLLPANFFGQILLHQRFAMAVIPLALLALDPAPPIVARHTARALVVIVVVAWMAVLTARFHQFHGDAEGFDRMVDVMPANERVVLLNLMSASDSVPGVPFLHFAGYYQERKGGINGWSFSNNFPSLIRYKRNASVPRIAPIVTYDPRFFDWNRDASYDQIIVRSPVDIAPLVFAEHQKEVRLSAQTGMWWLYTKELRANACVPLENVDTRSRRPLLYW